MMKTVAILGPTGMLGSSVYSQLKGKYKLILVLRDPESVSLLTNKYGESTNTRTVQINTNEIIADFKEGFHNCHKSKKLSKLVKNIGPVDAVINCIGVTNRYSDSNPLEAFYINSAFPYLLSWEYEQKLIHITTDCVFSGTKEAPYDENSTKSPNDLYGLTKSLGEPSEKSLVFRTSIIGPEVMGFVSLIEWFKKQSGKKITGYTSHLWNGITTKEYGKICDKIISNRDKFPNTGLFHIYSNDVNKYEMLCAFKKKYKVETEIESTSPPKIDRRLRTIHDVCKKLNVPSFQNMIDDL